MAQVYTLSWALVALLFFTLPWGGSCSMSFSLHPDGSYQIEVDEEVWSSGTTALHQKKKWLDIQPAGNYTVSSGQDVLGKFQRYTMKWTEVGFSTDLFSTIFRVYEETNAIVFTQRFDEGFNSPDLPAALQEIAVSSVFPSFSLDTKSPIMSRGYLSWLDGHWGFGKTGYALSNFTASLNWGSSVTAFFRDDFSTCVFSSLNTFKLSMLAVQSVHAEADEFVAGLAGTVTEFPNGTEYESILYCNEAGINQAMTGWGKLLQKYHQKKVKWEEDATITHLSYWTGNGGYYYYNRGEFDTYEDAILGVYNRAQDDNIPISVMQLDSWWYYKEGGTKKGGLLLWEPEPATFPHGIEWIHKQIGSIPLVLHTKWLAEENKYRDKYEFVHENGTALPADPAWWDMIMEWAQTQGCAVYEQDWLVSTFNQLVSTKTTLGLFDTYLEQMDAAAEAHGQHILYCMALSSDWISSVKYSQVTHSRATHDYNPGNDQWNIGHTSLLLWSLGIVPFKDTFWTTEYQPESPWPDAHEPNSDLQALIATLSCGPVGISDSVQFFNRPLIMRTCRNDGMILKPDQPALPLDIQYGMVFPKRKANIPDGQIWATFSKHALLMGGEELDYFWWSVLVLELKLGSGYNLMPSELYESTGQRPKSSMGYYVWFWNDGRAPSVGNWTKFSDGEPIIFNPCPVGPKPDQVGYTYALAAPIFPGGWSILGEMNKFVPMSKHRITSIAVDEYPNKLWFKFDCDTGRQDIVTFAVVSPSEKLLLVSCESHRFDTVACDPSMVGTCVCM